MPTAVITPENLSTDFTIDLGAPKPIGINIGDGLMRKGGKIAVDNTVTGLSFPTHAKALAWLQSATWPDGIIFNVGKAKFVTEAAEMGVPGLSGAAPSGRVTPYHWAQTPTPAQILAAFLWFVSKTSTPPNALLPAVTKVGGFHFPRGAWGDESIPIELATGGTGQSITGEANGTVLKGITVVVGDRGCRVADFAMDGALRTLHGIIVRPRSDLGFREGVIDNIRILNRDIGIGLYGNCGHMNITRLWVSRCNQGRFVEQQVGVRFSKCDFISNYGHGSNEQWGGELRDIGVRFLGNGGYGVYQDPLPGNVIVEVYRDNISCAGNQTGPDQAGLASRLKWPILSMANNGAGKVRATLDLTSGPHHFFEGQRVLTVMDTLIYDGSADVLTCTETTVDLDLPYTANATGNLRHPGYDFYVNGASDEPIQRINDQFFTACNINNMYVQNAYNFQFVGNRNKVSLFCRNIHNFGRISNGRGRDDATWGYVNIAGTNDGHAEILFGQPAATGFNTAGGGMTMQVPDASVPIQGNNVVARHSLDFDSVAGMSFNGRLKHNGIPLESFCAAGGTDNAIVLTSGQRLSGTIPTGTKIRFRAAGGNSNSTTITLDQSAAIVCKTVTGVNLPATYIRADADTEAVFNGTNWIVRRLPEYGFDAVNGHFSKLENGMLNCVALIMTADITTAVGAVYRSAEATWTFAHAFADATRVAVSAEVMANGGTHWASPRRIDVASAGLTLWAPTSIAGRTGKMAAMGFWY